MANRSRGRPPSPRSRRRATPSCWCCVQADAESEDTENIGRRDVVLGVDVTDPCDEVIEFAFEAARTRHKRLRVLSAWSAPDPLTLGPGEVGLVSDPQRTDEWLGFLSAVLRVWCDRCPDAEVLATVVRGKPASALTKAASGAELLVVGHRLTDPPRTPRTGPAPPTVIHHVTCPVAVVPHYRTTGVALTIGPVVAGLGGSREDDTEVNLREPSAPQWSAAARCPWSSPAGSRRAAPSSRRCWGRPVSRGSAARGAGQHRGRQGLQQRPVPRLSSMPWYPAHDCGEGRQPGRPPAQRLMRRTATRLRRRAVQEARHRRTSDQPAEAVLRRGHSP
ncbi:universal stress protein [Streptomyces sp. enrichment culture]|uniref:universal stress protein n=1 Tax=Streptomyces sp. enrichment culture TaxID=1795815 RepID=UPI003F579701